MDSLGDALREFYSVFGLADEGPPPDFDVSGTFGDCLGGEIRVLREALLDGGARKRLRDCRELLDDLETRLGTEEFLREISLTPMPAGLRPEELAKGVLWFCLVRSLDKRQGGLPVAPFDDRIRMPLPLKVQMVVEGSLVLQLYVALVYMREGPLAELVRRGAREGRPCCVRVNKLLKLDFVRAVRNALSHGSFSACCAGLVFRDGGHDRVTFASPGFLGRLSAVLMLIQLQALAAASRACGE